MQQSSVYTDSLRLEELCPPTGGWHLYGSSRIGIYQTNKAMAQRTVRIENGVTTQLSNTHIEQLSLSRFYTERGAKRYELSNHLGNVLTVVTDKKMPVCSGTSVSYFIADIVSATDYSPFGAPLAERTWQGSEYRYGFNGKEKDNETYGTGDAYDFGARILDVRLGRWLSIDPKAWKYPHETPYAFVGNSPVVCVDPDGEEKIVVTGGADLHNRNRANFIIASKIQIGNYLDKIKDQGSKEQVTWLIFDLDYTEEEKRGFEMYAKELGINPPIYVTTVEDVTNYINSKSTESSGLSAERTGDQITDLSMFSHGVPGNVAFGYDNTGYTFEWGDPTNLNTTNAVDIDKEAFANNAQTDLYSCNSATPYEDLKQDFNSRVELVKSALTKSSLVIELSKETGQTVTGYIGRTSYVPVGGGKLPTGGRTGGDYSPTVGGSSIKSIKVTSKDGKATAN